MTPRSEPLLWLQLIALGAIPLELLLLLLVLAGADPGPVPGVERLLVWGLGALAPALLFWRRPPDCCSLLLIQVPVRGRSLLQRSLSRLQESWPPKLLAVLGAAVLLPLLWTLDSHAAFATRFSPLHSSNRFIALLLSLPLLTVLLWQWQQLVQSLWLLTRSAGQLEAAQPMTPEQLDDQHLCLGLPLLLLDPLAAREPSGAATLDTLQKQAGTVTPERGAAGTSAGGDPGGDGENPDGLTPELRTGESASNGEGSGPAGSDPSESEASEGEASERQASSADSASPEITSPEPISPGSSLLLDPGGPVSIEPEQAAEKSDGTDLDENVS
ncbi:low-complexity tail membrane protein [Cyanobium sp. NIES-981]|uniref:low-complexity tail membrane protein n=1 Tax=Cyanobium sp. NIES-981 TaxID=1851505 RepID=UPI0007DDDEDB|nr:low-complexity tail membrane protein [Cyanobium sp. NIES-981]SBO44637.1 conserved membrane protein of unknown function [Cyanobium sp. NIES-981]